MNHDAKSYIGRMEDGQAARVTTEGGRITEVAPVAGHDDLSLFLPVFLEWNCRNSLLAKRPASC